MSGEEEDGRTSRKNSDTRFFLSGVLCRGMIQTATLYPVRCHGKGVAVECHDIEDTF